MLKRNQHCSDQIATLFIAEYIRVKVVDNKRCEEGEAEGDGPHNQYTNVIGAGAGVGAGGGGS